MSTNSNALAKNYDLLTPRERLRMLLDAQARDDFDEVNRLRRTCPRKVYRTLDHQFDGADEAVMKLTLALCIDLARYLAIVEGADRLARCARTLFLIAGSEAVEDVLGAGWPDDTEPTEPASGVEGATVCLKEWHLNEFDELSRLAAERTPVAHDALRRVHDQLVHAQVVAVRSILEGLSRFTRPVLGLEAIDVIRAWMSPVARRIDALPPIDVAIDEGYAADTEQIAWRYWKKMVLG